MVQDWDIKARADACSHCGRPFADQETCFSVLAFGPEGYTRADFCAGCRPESAALSGAVSKWQGAYQKPPQTEPVLKKETAESLLRSLIEKGDEHNAGVVFILAVMLERKRAFTERGVQNRDDGALIRIYEHRATGDTFLIRDPQFGLDELEPLQRQVAAMLATPPQAPRGEPVAVPGGGEGSEEGNKKEGAAVVRVQNDQPERRSP